MLYRKTVRDVVVRLVGANVVGAAVVSLYLFLTLSTRSESGRGERGEAIVFAPILIASLWAAHRIGHGSLANALGWLRHDRQPTPAERAATLAEPWRQARLPFALWLVAAAVITVAHVAIFDASLGHNVRTIDGIVLGGLTTAALAFLLVEGAFRPVFALALREDPPQRPSTLGIRPRLLLAWAVGSGVPLVGLAFAPVMHEPEATISVTSSMVLLALIGLACGAIATLIVARSVSDPLDAVRHGVARVRGGDLDVNLTVDDGGEIGLLQSGLNDMVAGLRERQRLQELFGRHVGEQVARRVLAEPDALGGEQRTASALFVDLVGSTSLAQERVPTEVVATLNALFAAVVGAVGGEGGWVNKFEGDGAMCVFGAPDDQPDHAARALRAARAIRSDLEALALANPGLDAGIGISSGTVVAGNIGSEERYEYTVIGDPVNEASRLTDEAKGRHARVLASEHTIAAAGSEAEHWVPAGAVVLRGRVGRTQVFEPDFAGTSHRRRADQPSVRAD